MAETLTRVTQEALLSPQALARDGEADISRNFRANGSSDPDDPTYVAHAKNGFADWKLVVGGLVEEPLELSLVELRAMSSRTQITRHDCVEGWSCIGKWKGLRLSALLERARLKPDARYIVFYCADALGENRHRDRNKYSRVGRAHRRLSRADQSSPTKADIRHRQGQRPNSGALPALSRSACYPTGAAFA